MLHKPAPAEAHEVVIIMFIMEMRPKAQQGYRFRAPGQDKSPGLSDPKAPAPTLQMPALPASPLPLLEAPSHLPSHLPTHPCPLIICQLPAVLASASLL